MMLATPFEFFVLDFGTFMLEAPGFVPDATASIDGAQQGFGFFCD